MFLRDLQQQHQRHALICVLHKRKTRTVMKPHSKPGLKKFFPNIPDMAKKGERGMERVGVGKRTERVFVEVRETCFEDEY